MSGGLTGAGPGDREPVTVRGVGAPVGADVAVVPLPATDSARRPVTYRVPSLMVTTSTDATGLPGPDTLGLPVEGDVAGVSRALLRGEAVALRAEVAWPLPPWPVAAEGAYTIRLTDRLVEPAEREAVLRPPTLVVGVGASKGAPAAEVLGLVADALGEAGLSAASVAELATVDTKAGEQGIVEAARRLGVPLVTYSAAELARVEVPNPSGTPLAAAGTPSVAEASALLRGGELLVAKRKSAARPAMATCAVVRRAGRPEPLDPVRERYGEAHPGDPRMTCDACVHRIGPPGFEDKAGLPRQPRLRPDDDGHHHGHRHVHDHHHGAHRHAH